MSYTNALQVIRGNENDSLYSVAGVLHQLRKMNLSVLAVFLGLDLLLIFIYIAIGLLVQSGYLTEWPWWRLYINPDWSLGEILNYIKWMALCCLMIVAGLKRRSLLLASLALLFFVVLLDDSLKFHERAGTLLAIQLSPWLDRPYVPQLGEVVFWTLMALSVALPITFGWRTADMSLRRIVLPMALLFGGVVACGVGFDVIQTFHSSGTIGNVIGLLENGGEMVFASALLAYTVGAFPMGSPAAPDASRPRRSDASTR